ncbi:MAG: hypothetical protein AAF628_34910 [Planctomycetota bacterium]
MNKAIATLAFIATIGSASAQTWGDDILHPPEGAWVDALGGNDQIYGAGLNTIEGGPGHDYVKSGGESVVHVEQDGFIDAVDCQNGSIDHLWCDWYDVIAVDGNDWITLFMPDGSSVTMTGAQYMGVM